MESAARQWPDLEAGRPDDWDPEHWDALQCLAAGRSQAETAVILKRSRTTIKTWISKWRAIYGDDFARYRSPGVSEEDRLKGQIVRRENWEDRRSKVATELGAAAEKSTALATAILDLWLNDIEGCAERFTPADVAGLARAAERLARQADRISGIPEPTRLVVVPDAPAPEPVSGAARLALDAARQNVVEVHEAS